MACQPGSSGGSARQMFSLLFLKGLPPPDVVRGVLRTRFPSETLPRPIFGGCTWLFQLCAREVVKLTWLWLR
jgi:hypothetical protein